MIRLVCCILSLLLAVFCASTASARPQYKKAFDEKYKDVPADAQAALKTAACNVCHVVDKAKTQRNRYGEVIRSELGKSGWDGARIKEALGPGGNRDPLLESLKKVLETADKEKDAEGKPYGEQFKDGHLPK